MKHISLDREDDRIKEFVRSLPVEPDGSLLELRGKAVLRVLPATPETVDRAKLRAAILKRRDESRRLDAQWQAVDAEMWSRIPETRE